MMPYRIAVLVFVGVAAALAVINLYVSLPIWFYLVWVLIFLTVVITGVVKIQLNFFLKSICKGPDSSKAVALTFDDGPGEYTAEILDILKKYNAKATFFCIGQKIPEKKQLLRRIYQEGHIIGNHSYSHHFWFDFFSVKKMLKELQQTEALIYEECGVKTRFFRPPYGVTNPNIRKTLQKMNYTSICWSLRSGDTTASCHLKVLKRLKKKIDNGDIVLLHDNTKTAASLLPDFLEYLLQNDYNIVSLDTLINKTAYA